ncbi:MAG: hypothetical protein HY400_06185 [Elusimicrobia bacterium]|nr:hypothetical protein [Elusimicrobiota bacterium]
MKKLIDVKQGAERDDRIINWRSFVSSYHLIILSSLLLSSCAPRTTVQRRQAMSVEETEKVESQYTGPKRRIGVIDFENKTAYGQGRLGGAASDILLTELVKSGKFIVVERDKLGKLMEEQKLGMTGVIDSHTAAKVGKVLGLNAIVTGAVSQFGVKTEGSDYLISQSKRQVAEVTVDIRVVDVETGQILLADSGKGVSKKGWGSFLGMGTKGGYDETLEGDALRAAIVQFVDNIISQVNKKPWSCQIAEAIGNELYLNAGQESGLEVGTELECFHLGRAIKDPSSGLVIGNTEESLGTAKVMRYCGQGGDCSIARLQSSGGVVPAARDICRLPQ